ncbi:MAG: hypothetical protein II007_13435 [Gammaproteobacteria bacterium]|nr:hypothetical protein [Gammaproteobacteria bacterium]
MSADKATAASYVSSGGMFVIGGLNAQEWLIVLSILFTLATFAVNTYCRRQEQLRQQRQEQRERERHEWAKAEHKARLTRHAAHNTPFTPHPSLDELED